jgi:hypothetical protein
LRKIEKKLIGKQNMRMERVAKSDLSETRNYAFDHLRNAALSVGNPPRDTSYPEVPTYS